MLRTLAVTALMSAALVACKGQDSKAPSTCDSGYVLTQGNVCVLQNIVDYNQCVENAAARESIDVALTKDILGRLQLQWVGPNIGPNPQSRARASKFIELNPGSCRELEVVWGCYQVANKVQEAATEPPICSAPPPVAGKPAATGAPAGAPAATPAPVGAAPAGGDAPK